MCTVHVPTVHVVGWELWFTVYYCKYAYYNGNNGNNVKTRLPACCLGGNPDQKLDYHLAMDPSGLIPIHRPSQSIPALVQINNMLSQQFLKSMSGDLCS